MRGRRKAQQAMFVAFNVEARVPDDHPLRDIKRRCDRVLADKSRDFDKAYGTTGRVGIPPGSLLKALLLCTLIAIPSERRLCEAVSVGTADGRAERAHAIVMLDRDRHRHRISPRVLAAERGTRRVIFCARWNRAA